MSNDLYDPSAGGDLQPYQPGGDLQSYQPDDWSAEPDLLTEHAPGLVPANGQLPQQAEANFKQLATIFTNDFQALGFVNQDIQKCIAWFKQSLTAPAQRMPARKSKYNLWQYSNDAVMNHFALYAETQGFSQNLIQSVCYWLQEFENRMAAQQQQVRQGPVSSDPTDNLSDADYTRVQQINAQAAARTEGYLKELWGNSFAGNMQVVAAEWNKLSDQEQATLEQYATGWVKGTNTPEILLGLFRQAIGAGSLPQGGAAIAQEIASIENVMRTERGRYMKDAQMQARLRTLYQMRDG